MNIVSRFWRSCLFDFNDTKQHNVLENRKNMFQQASYPISYFIILESYIETGKRSNEMPPSFREMPSINPITAQHKIMIMW